MSQNQDLESLLKGREMLILEDDLMLSKQIAARFESRGAAVTRTESLEQARQALGSMNFDFALLDLNLPDGESLDLLRQKVIPSNTLVILMTGEGGIQSAVEAMQLGAVDYLSKPFELDEILLTFIKSDKLRKNQRLIQHGTNRRKQKTANLFFEGDFQNDLGQLSKVTEIDDRLKANLPPLLIEGPTGSGKSTYARWVHDHGPRHQKPFVAINCSAIPDNLVESELFGHEKGAFTDAKNSRIGLFEAADRGTLFLDEISSLSLEAQAKLLLTIENGIIRRIGGTQEIEVEVRIIAAANHDLRSLIQKGKFREDLFHRLDLLRVSIPPLSSRGKDIPKLAKHCLEFLSHKYRLPSPKLDEDSKTALVSYSWPGNIRELIHELERSMVVSTPGQPLQLGIQNHLKKTNSVGDWLNQDFLFPAQGFKFEKEILRLIDLAIEQSSGNVSQAARLLGVKRDFIRYRQNKSQ